MARFKASRQREKDFKPLSKKCRCWLLTTKQQNDTRQLPFKRGSYDRLIAAHALSLGLTVVTGNTKHFADVPGLKVENWTV